MSETLLNRLPFIGSRRPNKVPGTLITLMMALIGLTSGLGQRAQAQTCDVNNSLPSQDCIGAISLCATSFTYPTGGVCGPGRIPGELGTNSCLRTNERTTTWYRFQVRRSGRLDIVIRPLDTDINTPNGGSTDYDFALIRLPAGTTNTANICSQIAVNSGNQNWFVRCNYSGQSGITGISSDPRWNTAAGKFEDEVLVQAGEFYMFAVDNFSSGAGGTGTNRTGYEIILGDPDADPTFADVRPPSRPLDMDSVTSAPNCVSPTLRFGFNNAVRCDDITLSSFRIVNRDNPSRQYFIAALSAQQTPCGPEGSRFFNIEFTPAEIGRYWVILNETVRDICGNTLFVDTLSFEINPFARIEASVFELRQDTVCSGNPIFISAITDTNLRAPLSTFRFEWSLLDTLTGQFQPLVASDTLEIDTNRVSITQRYPRQRTFRYRVRVSSTASSCVETLEQTIRIDPNPTVRLAPFYATCFGDRVRVAPGPIEDSVLYIYRWRPRTIQQPAIPFVGNVSYFDLVGDTVNALEGRHTLRRGQFEDLNLEVAYKPEFGGCPSPELRTQLRVGKFLKASFDLDTFARPGSRLRYVYDTGRVYNQSRFRTLDSRRQTINERLEMGDGQVFAFVNSPEQTPEFPFTYENEGQYLITLRLTDSLAPGVICSSIATMPVNVELSRFNNQQRLVDRAVIPNVFTPNGDNINEYLEFIGLPRASYDLEIYNRWGRRVYRQDSYTNDWQAPGVETGIYFYRLARRGDALNQDGPPEFKGWLEIVR